ncbi:MAG: HNH endonuclease [Gemmatimonadota bacterium]
MAGRKPQRNGRRRGEAAHRAARDTSVPTGRAAYTETRRWLLEVHGPVCAYCGVKHAPRGITLDHVTPRKGQSAYDRRDNLVLACKRCNAAKADKPFLIYLLASPARAGHLARFGSHLSAGILAQVMPIAATLLPAASASRTAQRVRVVYGPGDESDSPYADD